MTSDLDVTLADRVNPPNPGALRFSDVCIVGIQVELQQSKVGVLAEVKGF